MVEPLTLYATADWRFVIEDMRGADGRPLDLTDARVRIRFAHASLRNYTITELERDHGITVMSGPEGSGPTITILSRACERTWRPEFDTPVIGDLMMYTDTAPDTISEPLQRIAFIARWGSTEDGR